MLRRRPPDRRTSSTRAHGRWWRPPRSVRPSARGTGPSMPAGSRRWTRTARSPASPPGFPWTARTPYPRLRIARRGSPRGIPSRSGTNRPQRCAGRPLPGAVAPGPASARSAPGETPCTPLPYLRRLRPPRREHSAGSTGPGSSPSRPCLRPQTGTHTPAPAATPCPVPPFRPPSAHPSAPSDPSLRPSGPPYESMSSTTGTARINTATAYTIHRIFASWC